MLHIHVLNVRHGDSIVIQYDGPSGTVYGVIDSNSTKDVPCAALTKLEELGASSLSFVALTHPDCDHYSGLSRILKHFQQRIAKFYSFPLGVHTSGRLKEYAQIYKRVYEKAGDEFIRRKIKEFIEILVLVKEYIGEDNWDEPRGPSSQIFPPGFAGVEINVLLPLPRLKGPFFDMIKRGDWDVAANETNNGLSLAFNLRYKGHEIILAGDGTAKSWLAQKQEITRGLKSLRGNIVKLPHHGAEKDNTDNVLEHLYGENDGNVALISANGISHPAQKTLQRLDKKRISPYCTNLSKYCSNIRHIDFSMAKKRGIHPRLSRFLYSNSIDGKIHPCQGDISVLIDDRGELSITSQYENACPRRGELNFL